MSVADCVCCALIAADPPSDYQQEWRAQKCERCRARAERQLMAWLASSDVPAAREMRRIMDNAILDEQGDGQLQQGGPAWTSSDEPTSGTW